MRLAITSLFLSAVVLVSLATFTLVLGWITRLP
jgi:hypothetical protein